MMNEDAAQKSDSGEKFNGSSQRRKKPKKVNSTIAKFHFRTKTPGPRRTWELRLLCQ
ncbi:TPA: hypothetical protein BOS_6396 [Bos taurus]|nr:TPA: hypothetical protein BOS_6396 [Bos taurus]